MITRLLFVLVEQKSSIDHDHDLVSFREWILVITHPWINHAHVKVIQRKLLEALQKPLKVNPRLLHALTLVTLTYVASCETSILHFFACDYLLLVILFLQFNLPATSINLILNAIKLLCIIFSKHFWFSHTMQNIHTMQTIHTVVKLLVCS